MYWDKAHVAELGTFAIDTAGQVAYVPGVPIDAFRVVLVIDEALTVADSVITVEVQDMSGATVTTVGTATAAFTGSAVGDVLTFLIDESNGDGTTGSDGSLVQATDGGVVEVDPGFQIALVSDGGSTAGGAQAFIEYVPQGFSGERVEDAVELEFTSA